MSHICPICQDVCHCIQEEINSLPYSICLHCKDEEGEDPQDEKDYYPGSSIKNPRIRKWARRFDIFTVLVSVTFCISVALYKIIGTHEFAHAAVILLLLHIMFALMNINRRL